ncbi:MAG: hypothetical protein DHS20C21_15740 [Gemmatimonadota bacterium]|nr:MAG: hypothetical protein DHS20C21_15740 [Gemmatimonadota bacterium]
MSLLDEITKHLDGGALKQISSAIGADEAKTAQAASAALPALLGALARNSSQSGGAEAISSALSKDHDGSVLDNLSSFLSNPGSGKGDGILNHVLGGKRGRVESSVGKASGLDPQAVGGLMTMLAPIVMGSLGKAKRTQNLDASSLANLLGQERKTIESSSPAASGLMGQLLDADGDGDVDLSDMASKGMGMLGKMFGR